MDSQLVLLVLVDSQLVLLILVDSQLALGLVMLVAMVVWQLVVSRIQENPEVLGIHVVEVKLISGDADRS